MWRPDSRRAAHERGREDPRSRRRAAYPQAAAHGAGTHGYECSRHPHGKAALELLAKKPDLVILDLGLPDIEGPGAAQEDPPRPEIACPLVVLSSRGDEAGKVAALDLAPTTM